MLSNEAWMGHEVSSGHTERPMKAELNNIRVAFTDLQTQMH